ncbi:2'-5' RNA ligase [Tamaricihabitans halophyticus]|uniref:2'-5' RNA ligase n=1 Tax=Tamaricihabitans halophyticus TaxID=1262583 RepID=A0A4R2PXF0_9PSEU|nr:2'-5' RNA ligase family protein [Tamaricihabitans halophyticus]TCP40780.1 2'-5' RNA ligase [Tamaricihabitans halophyticus]
MSPFPANLIDRWKNRSEPRAGEGKLYWHVLLGENLSLRDIAQDVQSRLRDFEGIHLTPPEWLHMTILVAGSTNEIATDAAGSMLDSAAERFKYIPPVDVTFGRILYHPEAIMLGIQRNDDLEPIRQAVQDATRSVIGRDEGVTGGADSWVPHVTIGYSTTSQPAEPIIQALGTQTPVCPVTIDEVTLVDQQGAERRWDWHPIGSARLSG